MSQRARGDRAEAAVAAALVAAGWRVVARNWSCRVGELDLVVEKQGRLRVVEVKYRRRASGDWDLVSPAQQRRIGRAARHFLDSWGEPWCEVDVVVAEVSGPVDRPRIAWWDGAFEL